MNRTIRWIVNTTFSIVSLGMAVNGFSSPSEVSSLATVKGCLFAGTYSGKVFASQDSGLHWTDVSQGLCDTSSLRYQKMIKCLTVTGDDSIHAITACGEFASAVPDVHWKRLSADSCMMEYCQKCIANMEYRVRVNEWMIKSFITGPIEWSKDSGKTWTIAVPGCPVCSWPIVQCLYFDTISALAGMYGNTSNIIVSTDSGRTWRATGLTGIATGISSITRLGRIAFAGAENGVYASRDNFTTWWVAGESSRCSSAARQKNSISKAPGHLLKEIRQDGKSSSSFFYDSFGRLTADSAYSAESFSYDSLGRLAKRRYSGFEETYHYGIDGALSSMTKYFAATDKTWSEVYHRGPDGAIIDASTFYNGDTAGYVRYKYDCAGNTVERSEYSKDGMLYYQERCAYDSLVNPLQISFPFDMVRKGNIVSYYYYSVFMSSPPPQYSSSFQYDAAGLPLRETRIRTGTNEASHFEYVYDKKVVTSIQTPSTRRTAAISFLAGALRSTLVVSLNLTVPALTSISLCDLSGRRVSEVLKQTVFSAGNHRISLSLNGNIIPRAGGVYLCVVKAGMETETFRMPIIK